MFTNIIYKNNKNITHFVYTAPQEVDRKVQESIKWLDENVAPWELVLQHWLLTFDIRRKDLNNFEEKSLNTVFNKWSVLKHPQGYQLIVQDFNTMDLSKVSLNVNIWMNFVDMIITHTSYAKHDDVNVMLDKLKQEDISIGNFFSFVIFVICNYDTVLVH